MKPRASSDTMAAILNGVFVVILCILWYSNIVLLDQGEVQRVTTKHPPQQQTFSTSRKTTTTSSSQNQDEYRDDKPLVVPPIYSITTTTATTNDNRTTTADFHIVFSTGCNAFQDCE